MLRILEVGGTKGSRYVALSEHSEGAIINLCKDNIYAKLKEEVDDFLKADICNCTSSSECRFGESCIEGECVVGCLRNSDCLGDEQCDFLTQQCEPRTCENTDLDCPTGAFCRSSQNACIEDSFDHCATCTSMDRDIDRSTYLQGGNLNSIVQRFHEGFFDSKSVLLNKIVRLDLAVFSIHLVLEIVILDFVLVIVPAWDQVR